MHTQISLAPVDVPVALRLAACHGATYAAIARDLGISVSTAHHAIRRLQAAGIVRSGALGVNRRALLEFLEHGVRYAFPGQLDAPGRGVPTAHASPALSDVIAADDAVVWPDPNGQAMGPTLRPLFPQAVELPTRCPDVYELLTLVDAIRIGRARERTIAITRLRERLGRAVEAHVA
jgi:DNA-binding Lrp family transcriptional regulator